MLLTCSAMRAAACLRPHAKMVRRLCRGFRRCGIYRRWAAVGVVAGVVVIGGAIILLSGGTAAPAVAYGGGALIGGAIIIKGGGGRGKPRA